MYGGMEKRQKAKFRTKEQVTCNIIEVSLCFCFSKLSLIAISIECKDPAGSVAVVLLTFSG